jgi:hypothetical protein
MEKAYRVKGYSVKRYMTVLDNFKNKNDFYKKVKEELNGNVLCVRRVKPDPLLGFVKIRIEVMEINYSNENNVRKKGFFKVIIDKIKKLFKMK